MQTDSFIRNTEARVATAVDHARSLSDASLRRSTSGSGKKRDRSADSHGSSRSRAGGPKQSAGEAGRKQPPASSFNLARSGSMVDHVGGRSDGPETPLFEGRAFQ